MIREVLVVALSYGIGIVVVLDILLRFPGDRG